MGKNKKLTLFTLGYFGLLPYLFFLFEALTKTYWLYTTWHFLYNMVTLIILAATLFLITLNNPINNNVKRQYHQISNSRLKLFSLYNRVSYAITLIAPFTVINSKSIDSVSKVAKMIWVHPNSVSLHINIVQLLIMALCLLAFPVLFLNASVINSKSKSDDRYWKKFINRWINNVETISENHNKKEEEIVETFNQNVENIKTKNKKIEKEFFKDKKDT